MESSEDAPRLRCSPRLLGLRLFRSRPSCWMGQRSAKKTRARARTFGFQAHGRIAGQKSAGMPGGEHTRRLLRLLRRGFHPAEPKTERKSKTWILSGRGDGRVFFFQNWSSHFRGDFCDLKMGAQFEPILDHVTTNFVPGHENWRVCKAGVMISDSKTKLVLVDQNKFFLFILYQIQNLGKSRLRPNSREKAQPLQLARLPARTPSWVPPDFAGWQLSTGAERC